MLRLVALLLLVAASPTHRVFPVHYPYPRVRGEHGLWLGSIHLCGADVAGTVRGKNPIGLDTLTLNFAPSIQPRLKSETTRLVGQPLPVRVDGVTVSMPTVNEPIQGTQLELNGPDRKVFDAIERAARAPC